MLGLHALGVETNEWARATSRAAGHACLAEDVAALDPLTFSPVWGLIGSPPCQAYSSAGKGLGRQDKPHVIACAHELAAGNGTRSDRLAECADARSLLTVEPLRYPLEQVPAVLELWSLFAGLLSAHGYQTATGILSAERYGVPQTRKRAFLIASLDASLELPPPTHRSYNPRRGEIPDEELALKPWLSMAEALGRSVTDQTKFPRRNDTASNRAARSDALAATRRSPDGTLVGRKLPPGAGVERSSASRNGMLHNAAVRASGERAPTVFFGHAQSTVEWPCVYKARQRGAQPRPVDQPAPTMLAAGLAKGTPVWAAQRPATTTVTCGRRVHPHKQNAGDPPGRYQQRRGVNALRVIVEQAAILQGFPPDYPWQGARTYQFEQIGNAVPPPLAHAVLEKAIVASRCARRPKTRRS